MARLGRFFAMGANVKHYQQSIEQGIAQLKELSLKVAANPCPGLLERWTAGLIAGNVPCPWGVDWKTWVSQVRSGWLDKPPWERT